MAFVENLNQKLNNIKKYSLASQEQNTHGNQYYYNIIIIAASAKGLCGGFNSQLERTLLNQININPEQRYEFVLLGKKAESLIEHTKFLQLSNCGKIILPNLQIQTLPQIIEKIKALVGDQPMVNSIAVLHNHFKSIFYYKPKYSTVFSFDDSASNLETKELIDPQDLICEQEIDIITKLLSNALLETSLYSLLHESILCETAARFVTTDGATQSARKKIEQLSLQYNKIRQAMITREVAELSSCV
jgi:F-type H+-transporting ATPase subunit gamma